MFSKGIDWGLPLAIVELFARVASIASITLLVMLFIGEGFNPTKISTNEWVGLLFFPTGVVIGMAIAWWKEGLGSMVTLGSLIGLYLVWGYLMGNHIGGWWFVVFSSPGILFLLHCLLHSVEERRALA